MTDRLAILLLTTAANLLLGVAVWARNSSQRVTQYFAFFSLSMAGWTLSNALVATYAATPWGLIWARAAFLSASAIPLAFFLFVSVFPVPRPHVAPGAKICWITAGTIAAVVSLTPLIASDTADANGVLKMTYGPLHPLFAAYVLAGLAYSVILLYRKLRILTGIERLQVRYIVLAVSLPLVGGTVTNLLIPLAFGSSQFSPYGPLLTIPMAAVIAHAVIRHRLMNTRLVIQRGVAYLVTTLAAAAIFTLPLSVVSGVLVHKRHDLPLSVEVLLVLFIAVAFQPIQRGVRSYVDRYLFRQRYDYQRTIREISRTMAAILDLQPLLKYACEAISRTVQPEHVAVYTRDTGGAYCRLITHSALSGDEFVPDDIPLAHSSRLARFLATQKRMMVLDELRAPGVRTAEVEGIIDNLQKLHAAIVLPLLENDDLTGFFILGRKLSGDPYFTEDLDLLATLTSQATIALKNAQLYSQVVLINEYVENIITTIESGVIAIGADGHVTLFNATAERLTGLDAKQMKAVPLEAVPVPIAELLEGTLRDKQARTQVETTLHRANGTLASVICSTSALRDRDGAMLGAVAVFSDLTHLKTLEDEKRQAERLASIGAFASGIAHEIKNPLVAIKTFAELLPERFAEEDFRNDFARVVVTEIDRIDDLVARLRGLATASTQTLIPLDVRTPIEETLALLRGQLELRRIAVSLHSPNELPLVSGDHAQLKQLFLNLLMNAVEAMQPGGEIAILVATREAIGTRTVVIRISDTGPGIPPSLISRIFDPFVTTKERGSGLGLSICRGITDAHRATIRAENSRSGSGATIVMEFPVVENAPSLAS